MMRLERLAAVVLMLGWLGCGAAADPDGYTQAAELHQRGDDAAALARLDTHLADHPRDSRARFLKAIILAKQNRTQEAIEVLTMLSEEFPELPEPHNNLAVLYAGQGRYEDARRELEMAVRAYPDYAVAHQNLGDIYATLAAQAYEQALRADPNNSVARAKLEEIRKLLPERTVAATPPPASVPAVAPAPAVQATAPPPASAPAPSPAAVPPPASPALPASSRPPASPQRAADPLPPANPPPAAAASDQPRPSSSPAAEGEVIREVLDTVRAWAGAWTAQDVDKYLSFYARDFRTPKGEARGNWEADRRKQIRSPRVVTVDIVDPNVTIADPSRAAVTFKQNYRADAYRSSGRKTLVLVRQGERWLIQQETITFR
jgi:tetratricopeptide (TPR) repeat protein